MFLRVLIRSETVGKRVSTWAWCRLRGFFVIIDKFGASLVTRPEQGFRRWQGAEKGLGCWRLRVGFRI